MLARFGGEGTTGAAAARRGRRCVPRKRDAVRAARAKVRLAAEVGG